MGVPVAYRRPKKALLLVRTERTRAKETRKQTKNKGIKKAESCVHSVVFGGRDQAAGIREAPGGGSHEPKRRG